MAKAGIAGITNFAYCLILSNICNEASIICDKKNISKEEYSKAWVLKSKTMAKYAAFCAANKTSRDAFDPHHLGYQIDVSCLRTYTSAEPDEPRLPLAR